MYYDKWWKSHGKWSEYLLKNIIIYIISNINIISSLFTFFRSDSEDCNTRRSDSGNVATASALGLVNIGGVFVVLLVGMHAIKENFIY